MKRKEDGREAEETGAPARRRDPAGWAAIPGSRNPTLRLRIALAIAAVTAASGMVLLAGGPAGCGDETGPAVTFVGSLAESPCLQILSCTESRPARARPVIRCARIDPSDCSFTSEARLGAAYEPVALFFVDDRDGDARFDPEEPIALSDEHFDGAEGSSDFCNGDLVRVDDVALDFEAGTYQSSAPEKEVDACTEPAPTSTPEPTPTVTFTPVPTFPPTATPEPTETPEPTMTPTPDAAPTPTPVCAAPGEACVTSDDCCGGALCVGALCVGS